MAIRKSFPFLSTATMVLFCAAMSSQGSDLTFFTCSDTHYLPDYTNNANQRAAIDQMNALPGQAYPDALGGGTVATPRGVLVLGDLINDGANNTINTQEWAHWAADFGVNSEGRVAFPVYEGFGNHDLNVNRFVQKRIIDRALLRTGLTAVSTNGLHYSMDWDGVHLVQLGLFPGNVWKDECNPQYSTVHDPEYARDFLKDDLRRNVGRRGRPVVVTHHFDVNDNWWTDAAKCLYYHVIRDYNIICIAYGHTGTGLGTWRGLTTVNDSNLAGGGSFVYHVTPSNQLVVGRWNRSAAWDYTLRKNITVPSMEQAWEPVPADGHEVVDPGATRIAWRPGDHAVSQALYFGTSSNAVRAGTTPDIAGLGAAVTNAGIPPAFAPLQAGTDYYWRVDETLADGSIATGAVWRFRTRDLPATNDVTFLFVSDTHYGTTTLDATRQTVLAMNAVGGTAYPDDLGGGTVQTPRGVLHGGDKTDHAYDWEWSIWTDDYGVNGEGVLSYPAYEIYGNHDGSLGTPAGDGIVERNKRRAGLSGISSNGLHYSWDWDNVHFVNVGVRPGGYTNPYNPQGSLEFLTGDLAAHVGTSGRPVVIYQHFGYDDYAADWWTEAERARMYEAIKNYNVIGIFHGHTHSCTIYRWNGIDIYNAPHMDFGTFTEGFFVAHVTSNRLTVAERKADGSWGTRASKPIFMSYAESGLPAIVNNGIGATNILGDTATLTGRLVYEAANGTPTAARIYWGPTDGGTNPAAWTNVTTVGTVTSGVFASTVGGLGGNRVYYYRCFATNNAGAAWADVTATFQSGAAAQIGNGSGATAVTRTSATLNGELVAAIAYPTEVTVFWGTADGATSTANWSNAIPLGSLSPGAFSAPASSLAPDTRYYYRCYATNAAGDAWADASATFLTLSQRPQAANAAASAVTRTSAILNGVLVSTGSAPTRVVAFWGGTDGGTSPTNWEHAADIGGHPEGPVATLLTGLTVDQAYFFRFYATNLYGDSWAATSAVFRTLQTTGSTFLWDGAGTNITPADWNNPLNWVGDSGFPNGAGQAAWFTNRTYLADHLILRLNGTIVVGEVRFVDTDALNDPTTRYVDAFGLTNDTVIFATDDGGDAEFRYENSGDPRMLCFQANMVLSNTLHYLNYQNRNGAGILGLVTGPGGLRVERYRGANDSDFVLGRAGDPPNTYAGGTTLSCGSTGNRAGTFNVRKNGAFGKGDVTVGAYEIVVLEDRGVTDDMIDDHAGLYLQHSGTNRAKLMLNAGVSETVGNLFVYNDTSAAWEAQATGTWGSSASAATFQNDDYFGGTGVLVVVAAAAPLKIQASGGPHGVIVPAGEVHVMHGSNLTFGISADSHYHVADVLVDGQSQGPCPAYLFSNITNTHTIEARFAPNLTTNGTPEWWMSDHGMTNGPWEDLSRGDPDGDGSATWQEWQADTDPTNPASVLGLAGMTRESGLWRIQWKGGQQSAQVLERATAPDGEWVPLFTNVPPTPAETSALDVSGTNAANFYRVRAVR